ncbi:PREDICTED: uncharacterized protein LOC104768004 [Camelina sativa]|uniref:Uncharacterized protein LOC104768004 n=1 Tax=Camelina sativa TaxID=90675 RepID=A0ABM0XSA0_CAMSA|nr:PREDICTED: uncharacterized protein LOC104768004 [Camelina sativa]
MTWLDFVGEFNAKYFPQEALDRMEARFLGLTQGNRTVRELDAEFSRLVGFAGRALEPESAQVRRFLLAPQDDLRTRCRVRSYPTRAELVETTGWIEDDLSSQVVVVSPPVQPKQTQPPSTSGKGGKPPQGQKRKFDVMQRSGFSGAGCFGCGSLEQRVASCPHRVMSAAGGADSVAFANGTACVHDRFLVHKVCVGTLLVGGFPSHVLFDSGATHCFVTLECAERGNIRGDPRERFRTMKVAGGGMLQVYGWARDVDIQVAGESMLADLVISPVELYDVIFGMEWLHLYRVHLDCHRGKVGFDRLEAKSREDDLKETGGIFGYDFDAGVCGVGWCW